MATEKNKQMKEKLEELGFQRFKSEGEIIWSQSVVSHFSEKDGYIYATTAEDGVIYRKRIYLLRFRNPSICKQLEEAGFQQTSLFPILKGVGVRARAV